MKFDLEGIKTIVFDLGGVVLNLDIPRTFDAFAKLARVSVEELLKFSAEKDVFHPYETGQITTDEFLNRMLNLFGNKVSHEQIIDAWNAMLLDLPQDRIHYLDKLRSKYKTIVLSNTNDLHLKAFEQIVSEATNGRSLTDFFDHVYYSHKIGMRKPNADIFEFVLEKHDLIPSETLFIDDMEQNIKGAANVGLKTWHMTDQSQLMTKLSYE